ncbi:hypothetical protein E3N88_12155 [Mikania micrantha]|uniref:Uncharacterized protein n=1 Tax=Mikania micrantha TaxID=192012 RepID=A0A5N6P7A0_9ASTR|nr:hypothetical protein E3N88_12155 [Mikania micrantha]
MGWPAHRSGRMGCSWRMSRVVECPAKEGGRMKPCPFGRMRPFDPKKVVVNLGRATPFPTLALDGLRCWGSLGAVLNDQGRGHQELRLGERITQFR